RAISSSFRSRSMFRSWFARRGTESARLRHARPRLESLEDRTVLSTAYLATDLVSDQPGVTALRPDPHLVNAWGISLSPNVGAFWVSDNGTGVTTLYTGDVTTNGTTSPLQINNLVVSIPNGAPTGQVFAGIADNFVISGLARNGTATSAPSS